MYITPSLLYNYIQCPHRPWRDKYGNPAEKLEPNEFVKLLWEKGVLHEESIVTKLGLFEDMEQYPYKERAAKTLQAMQDGVQLIYHGQLIKDELRGEPDLLRKVSSNPNKYMAIDIKSGQGYEGANNEEDETGKPKKHYAVQLCLYTDILERLGYSYSREGRIIDINNKEVEYTFDNPMGARTPQTFWEYYIQIKEEVLLLLQNKTENKPASSSICKLCPWYSSCKNWIKENDDMTQIYRLGRSIRDTLREDLEINTVEDLLNINLTQALSNKSKNFLVGIGESTLSTVIQRARVFRTTKQPVAYRSFDFPKVDHELFFDIEADPTQDHVYLHGVWERSKQGEKFVYFLAENVSPKEEKEAWAGFWKYIDGLEGSYSVYYYGSYEKTMYKHLREKYPEVISEDKLEEFFDNENVINLYNDVIDKYTDWPLSSYSIKEIAVYLGFKWRDTEPSGANSIKWYNEFVESGDQDIMKRIVEYNEDDCKATMVVKDWFR
ncbi:TM0106 family RecB-like putative nuclease [Candidatus Dojkabacteria bacterium]|nr:TM0106 family RecB-like putative nuclease [Candidatus Dojkabacteria bacterium]